MMTFQQRAARILVFVVGLTMIAGAARAFAQSINVGPVSRTPPAGMSNSSFPFTTGTEIPVGGKLTAGTCFLPNDGVTTTALSAAITVLNSSFVRIVWNGQYFTTIGASAVGQGSRLSLNVVDGTHVTVGCTRNSGTDWAVQANFQIQDLDSSRVNSIQRGTTVGSQLVTAVTLNHTSIDFIGASGGAASSNSDDCALTMPDTTHVNRNSGDTHTCAFQIIDWK